MKRIILSVALLLISFAVIASCGSKVQTKNIGGYEISEDLAKYLTDNGGTPEEFVSVYALADAEGCDYRSEDFMKKCGAERDRILAEDYAGDEDALDKELEEYGITDFFDKMIEQSVLKDELYGYLIENGKIESDPDATRTKLLESEAVRIKRILINAEDSAKLDEGYEEYKSEKTSFEQLSDDLAKYSAETGIGDYEDSYIVVKGNFDKEYENTCFSLEVGECSKPFSTSAGYCLVKRYELTEDIVDKVFDDLLVSYTEGQYNLMLESAAETLKQ